MNTHGSKWIRPVKRLAIYLRDGLQCQWCQKGVEAGAQLTLDHARARDQGGTNNATNLFTACHRCNSQRQNRTVAQYAEALIGPRPHPRTEGLINAIRQTRRRSLAAPLAKARHLMLGRSIGEAIREAQNPS